MLRGGREEGCVLGRVMEITHPYSLPPLSIVYFHIY